LIIVTGGAGFIGSVLVWQLNELGRSDIVVVDNLGREQKWQNLAKRQIQFMINKEQLGQFLPKWQGKIDCIFHLGACSATTEVDGDYLLKNNFQYSVDLFEYCTAHKIPFIYASSGATYGGGELGFDDQTSVASQLRPINKYGYSKKIFDDYVLSQKNRPELWVGLKFFNVYGPNEYHKGKMSSVVYHAFPQARDHSVVKLFKSYNSQYQHGEQRRDFIYVKDVVKVMSHILKEKHKVRSGIYNLGTGKSRTWVDLANSIFASLDKTPKIEFIEMPDNLRAQYQYLTEAKMDRARDGLSYSQPFYSLEEGVRDYVTQYLHSTDPYL
jgi:ADP-L-glycero-D-manno-heptose 6-epimerase